MRSGTSYKILNYYAFGMGMPGRQFNAGEYRYGYSGKENDDEVKGIGNFVDYGARGYDSRIAKWNRTDNVHKPYVSSYQFAQNNPINYLDPDGNDEIHFRYVIEDNLDGEGKAFKSVKFYTEIVKDGKEELTFFVGSALIGSKGVQIKPFIKDTRMANDYSNEAARTNQPGSRDRFFYNLFNIAVDDYSYLGILLNANPNIVEHYKGTKWEPFLKGAQSKEASRQFSEKLETGVEVAYILVDGFILMKAIGRTASIIYKSSALFSVNNITQVSRYLRGSFEVSAENEVMLARMEKINNGTMEATQIDKNFIKHELREMELRQKGYSYEQAHQMTLDEQGMGGGVNYHKLLYTEEALKAGDAAEAAKAGIKH